MVVPLVVPVVAVAVPVEQRVPEAPERQRLRLRGILADGKLERVRRRPLLLSGMAEVAEEDFPLAVGPDQGEEAVAEEEVVVEEVPVG